MQNYGNGQPQQPQQPQPAQQPQQPQQPQYNPYAQYGGYPYPPKRQSDGGILALLGMIFGLAAILFILVAIIVGAFAESKGAAIVFVIFMFLELVLAAVGLVFSLITFVKQKGKKLFYMIGLIAGSAGIMLFLSYFMTLIATIRSIPYMR